MSLRKCSSCSKYKPPPPSNSAWLHVKEGSFYSNHALFFSLDSRSTVSNVPLPEQCVLTIQALLTFQETQNLPCNTAYIIYSARFLATCFRNLCHK
jgi:hypothetical protein